MRKQFPYDGNFDPPAPVLPLRVAAPGREDAVLLPALVDTGADCTLIPRAVSRHLALRRIDRLRLEGIEGIARPAPDEFVEDNAGSILIWNNTTQISYIDVTYYRKSAPQALMIILAILALTGLVLIGQYYTSISLI